MWVWCLQTGCTSRRASWTSPGRCSRPLTTRPATTDSSCAAEKPLPSRRTPGRTVPIVFEPLPFEIVPLYFDLDGTFPNHPANPIEPENLVDLQRTVLEANCDIGIAFDGDADRVFLVDEKAQLISGSLTTALVAERLLKKTPGAGIIYNLICSWAVPEVIEENGGKPIRTRGGHSFIKQVVAETGAVFGGEHSGHYYFKDNFRADSGMIAALYVLETMSDEGKSLSELLAPLKRYAASGEINVRVG